MADLRYYIHDNAAAIRFQLIGGLTSAGALDLERAWRTASSTIGDRPVLLDLSQITGADVSGREHLEVWLGRGARLIVTSGNAQKRLQAITALPVSVLSSANNAARFSSRTTLLRLALFFLLLSPATGANLNSVTIQAWEQYIQTVTAGMCGRAAANQPFLWVDESPERLAKVRAAEIVVSPAGPKTPRKVPSGLVHDWIGAVFIPNTNLDQVQPVMRDYTRYKDYYRPVVVDSKTLALGESEDQFSILLSNPSLFRKSALETRYKSVQILVDDRRRYSITRTTRIREIVGYGAKNPRVMPEDQGTGLIWRLFSVTRLEERDGGVYIEVEAIALSRDIPATLRWLVEPIVRRTAHSALVQSLQQTRDAVLAARRSGNVVAGGR